MRTTELNYEIAKDNIKRWYGDEESEIRAIRTELMAIRDWRGRTEVKVKMDITESYIQQLSTLIGDEYNSEEARDVLMRCLPYSYVERVQFFKNRARGTWDLKAFREAMMAIIKDDDEMADTLKGRHLRRNKGTGQSQVWLKMTISTTR